MSCVVFAWQLGGNYGHLMTDLPIAECLRQDGHEVSFIIPDRRIGTELLAPAGFSFTSVPTIDVAASPRQGQASYAEIMDASGFGDDRSLARLLEHWSSLFRAARADVIVADHAPLAVLSARILGIPNVLIGNGFTVPPLLNPFPSIRTWESLQPGRLQQIEGRLLDRINTLGARQVRPSAVLTCLSQLFADSAALLTTFCELDPYGPRDQGTYVGPIMSDSRAPPIAWQSDSRQRVFAYLHPSVSRMTEVLTALEDSGAQVICAMPGASPELERHFAGTALSLLGHTVPLTPLLAGADCVVSHGGSGLISSSLLAGVPMLLVPHNPEQYLGSIQVAKLGAGIVVGPQPCDGEFAAALERLLGTSGHRDAARRYAAKYRDHDRHAAVRAAASVIAACVRHECS
jgi:UDP:flavonoid glycosyltransferase YjiC (YdhE family)